MGQNASTERTSLQGQEGRGREGNQRDRERQGQRGRNFRRMAPNPPLEEATCGGEDDPASDCQSQSDVEDATEDDLVNLYDLDEELDNEDATFDEDEEDEEDDDDDDFGVDDRELDGNGEMLDDVYEYEYYEPSDHTATGLLNQLTTRYNTRSRATFSVNKLRGRNGGAAGPSTSGSESAASQKKTEEDEQRTKSLERLKGILQAHVAWEGKQPQSQTDIARLIRSRESTGCWSPSKRTRVSSRVLPQGEPEVVDTGNSRAYIGHFAEKGNCFVAGFQNQTIRLYEVNHAHRPWKLRKEIVARALNWTITDTCLSPNQQLLVYATISPVLHAVNINATDDVRSLQNITDLHTPLDFGEGFSEGAFGLWAINFSHDGKFILAGSSDYATYIYDLAAQRVVSKAKAHKDDVNTVCFLDEGDNVYLSGSDDCYIKVWDRRCSVGDERSLNRPQGMLPGHTEGLTYLSPKGDGRYFISNGKDQKCKLWDVRSMSSNAHIKKGRFPKFYWDYRWQPYPGTPNKVKHPNDRSLATFTGHRVLQTLIRCRWSPAETTGQRYIFSGSQCGSLYVYDILTGETSAVFRFHRSVMRDCDWHPYQPLIASVGWDGTVVRWRKMAADVNSKLSPTAI